MEKQYQKKGIKLSDNRKFLSKTEAGRLTTKKKRTKRKIYDIQKTESDIATRAKD